MPFAVYFSIYKKRLMKRELKDKKVEEIENQGELDKM